MRGRGVAQHLGCGNRTSTPDGRRGHTQNVMGVAFSRTAERSHPVSGSSLAVTQAVSKPGELCLWATENRCTGSPANCSRRTALRALAITRSGRSDRNVELGPHDQALGYVQWDLRQSLAGH